MDVRRRVARSRLAPVAVLPLRAATVARYDARVVGRSLRWLVRSREHTNLTYDLTPYNLDHLAWFVAVITGLPVREVRGYMGEIGSDQALAEHVAAGAALGHGRADDGVKLGRRLGWYVITRALRPQHVVETGTDKGLGSVVFAAALLRNGTGRLTTIDVNPDSGYLISGEYAQVTDRLVGNSTDLLPTLSAADLFLHDSLHTEAHEWAEYTSARLTERAVVLSDHPTAVLPRWAEQNDRRFLFFAEAPANHWYPGSGIGAAF